MAAKPQAAATAAHPTSFKYTQALAMQEETRKARKFEKTESDLSSLALRQTTAPASAKFSASGKFQGILSYLGTKNPFPRTIGSEDTVWLLDNTAYRNAKTGKWETEYVAAMFSQHTSSPVMDAVNLVAQQVDMSEDDDGYGTLQERLMPFLQDIRPGTTVRVLHGGQSPPIKLGPGGRNGISADVKQIPDSTEGQVTTTFAKVPSGANGILECRTFYAEPEGWGVISDVDDTIKITQTSDPIGILQTTFVDTPQVCPGMPEFYQRIQGMIKETSPWFYLSASPYNLYPFLRDFRQHHFPHGTIILRDSSWMSIPGLLQTLTLGTEDYKIDRMEKIHGWLPKRKMICIGDSTQSDPEAYGEIYRKYPGWVKMILIRKVEDIAAIGIERKNEPQRFEEAFKDVPRDAWHVFHSPTECDELIQRVVAKDP